MSSLTDQSRRAYVIALTQRLCIFSPPMNHQWLSLFPAGVFFLAFFVGGKDFLLATKALMATVAAQLLLLTILRRPIPKQFLITAVLILIFGAITLVLDDAFFLQLKTTVINWLFAIALIIADFAFRKNLVHAFLKNFFDAADNIWRTASCWFAAFFFTLGCSNLIIINLLSTKDWVLIKTFIFPAATFVFTIGIVIYLSRLGEVKKDSQ